MSGQVPDVLLNVRRDGKQTRCIAKIIRGDGGKLYADSYIVPKDPDFANLGMIEIDGQYLDLLPDAGAGQPLHIYHGVV